MSFDDLFGLLLFVVFIALPALSRMAGSKKKPGAPGQGAPTQGRTPTASTARPTSQAPGGGTATTAGGGDELERRLAEARERVRRALEGPGGSSSSSSSAPASGGAQAAARPAPVAQPAARPTPVRRTAFVSKDRDDGLLSTPLDPSAVGGLGRKRTAPRTRPAPFAEAPALQVERPGSRSVRGASRSSAAFATDPETIRSAILWHQVLGEPRARRPLGGRPSTLRSR